MSSLEELQNMFNSQDTEDKPTEQDIQERLKKATTLVELFGAARALKAEGADTYAVNNATTERKREILKSQQTSFAGLKKVIPSKGFAGRRITQFPIEVSGSLNAPYIRFEGSKLVL